MNEIFACIVNFVDCTFIILIAFYIFLLQFFLWEIFKSVFYVELCKYIYRLHGGFVDFMDFQILTINSKLRKIPQTLNTKIQVKINQTFPNKRQMQQFLQLFTQKKNFFK